MAANRRYHPFEIGLYPADGQYRVEVHDSPAGQATGLFANPISDEELNLWQQDRLDGEACRQLGTSLFKALFTGEILALLNRSLSSIGDDALRINLRLHPVPELAPLPWELLYDPGRGRYLAHEKTISLVRYLALNLPEPERLFVKPPLRILAVLASPKRTLPVDVEGAWQSLKMATHRLVEQQVIELHRLLPPSPDELRRYLMTNAPHVLYFVGHGSHEQDREPSSALLFEGNEGEHIVVTADELGPVIANCESLRLVFLNACESALASDLDIFSGMATALVQQGVPALVAMQRRIEQGAATRFAEAFFESVIANHPLDAAMMHARLALLEGRRSTWATPVLFSRSADNLIVFVRPDCPYPGMLPFTESQRDLFFGREREIADARARLDLHPFLAVIGPSGSGKSSLIFAGMIPALRRAGAEGEAWSIHQMRPGDEPLSELTQCLGTDDWDTATFETRTLLFIDQFEEVFTTSDPAQADGFLDALNRLMARPDSRLVDKPDLNIVVTLRADFYSEVMSSSIWDQVRGNRLELTTPPKETLRAIIREPAATVGVSLDVTLVNQLLTDASGEPGALPLMQETMRQLWEKVSEPCLPFSAYEDMGRDGRTGLQVAIARRADVTVDNLDQDEQRIARRLFLDLIYYDSERTDVRRQRSESELVRSGDAPETFNEVLKQLDKNRLITLGGDETDGRVVDISHDALIRGWPQLQMWIAEHREGRLHRQRVGAVQRAWADDPDTSRLLRGRELEEALAWAERDPELFTDEQNKYLAKSRKRERRGRWTRSSIILSLILLLVPGTFVGANAWMFFSRQNSPWQPIPGFPSHAVMAATLASTDSEIPTVTEVITGWPSICVGTNHIGIGCSQDGSSWNLYQQGLPTGEPDWIGSSETLWGSLLGSVWSGRVRTVYDITFDPEDRSHIYVFLRDEGPYYSANGGATWGSVDAEALPPTFPDEGISKIEAHGDHLFVAAGLHGDSDQWGRLFVSPNRGLTWQTVETGACETGIINDFWLDRANGTDRLELLIVAEHGLFRARQENGWQPELIDAGPANAELIWITWDAEPEQFYLAAYDSANNWSDLYRWHAEEGRDPIISCDDNAGEIEIEAESVLTKWGAGHKGAIREFAVNPMPGAADRLWLLFERGDVLSMNANGNLATYPKRPGWIWSQSNSIWFGPDPDGAPGSYVPYVGHSDGILDCETCSIAAE